MLVSVAIILSITLCSILNCSKATKHTNELLDSIEAIDGADDIEGIERFCALWQKHRTFFVSTIPMDKIECADKAVLTLKASSKSGSADDFIMGRIFASDAIKELANFSRLSIQNIL